MQPADRSRGCRAVAALLVLGLGAYVALHLFEPRLPLTWAYAHLYRRPLLPWLAVVLLLALPPAAATAWRRPWCGAPVRPFTAGQIAGLLLLTIAAVGVVGFRFPAHAISIDPWALLQSVKEATNTNPRWHLTLVTYDAIARLLGGRLSPSNTIRGFSTVATSIGLVGLAGAARRLARTRGEAVAITLLVWTGFGTIQLAMAYIDVYPVALAIAGLFAWTALGTLRGRVHPLWPLALAGIGPFWYEGLVLLGPAAAFVALVAASRPGGVRRVAIGVALAVALAGLATVPGYGHPFAWPAYLEGLARASDAELGLSPTSSLLPAWALFSGWHANDVLQTVILVDGVGVLLVAVAGTWCVAARVWQHPWDLDAIFLAALVAPQLLFLFMMDPLWGAFADWDLFSWGAATTSLLGAYAFVTWGRRRPDVFPVLLGLALAAAGVHLLARLSALDVELVAHLRESPYHMQF